MALSSLLAINPRTTVATMAVPVVISAPSIPSTSYPGMYSRESENGYQKALRNKWQPTKALAHVGQAALRSCVRSAGILCGCRIDLSPKERRTPAEAASGSEGDHTEEGVHSEREPDATSSRRLLRKPNRAEVVHRRGEGCPSERDGSLHQVHVEAVAESRRLRRVGGFDFAVRTRVKQGRRHEEDDGPADLEQAVLERRLELRKGVEDGIEDQIGDEDVPRVGERCG
mmetsp:Transcript_39881/g.109832  ORF Transcript_39881/g.109832 Transcript_39881/m.109832 type:complete len:228 (-) Transcript_39881:657-1340(-)